MAVRVQLLTFQEDNLKEIIEKTYSNLRNWLLKQAEENLDEWDIFTIDFISEHESLNNLIDFQEEKVSRIISCFFDYLEMGGSKIKYKYYQSFISVRRYKDDFEIVKKDSSEKLQFYWRCLTEGRSLKDHNENFQELESEPDFKIGFLSKNERDFIIEEIQNNFSQKIKGTSIETVMKEFKEIGANYEQVIIQIS